MSIFFDDNRYATCAFTFIIIIIIIMVIIMIINNIIITMCIYHWSSR